MDDPVLTVTRVGRFRPRTHLLEHCHFLRPVHLGRRTARVTQVPLSELATARTCYACSTNVPTLARAWRDDRDDGQTWLVATHRTWNADFVSWHLVVYSLLAAWPYRLVDHPFASRQRVWQVPGRLARAVHALDDNEYEVAGPLRQADDVSHVTSLFADGGMDLQDCVDVVTATRH